MSPRLYTSKPLKQAVVALPTPPPSPYSAMSSAATNARHDSAAHPQTVAPSVLSPAITTRPTTSRSRAAAAVASTFTAPAAKLCATRTAVRCAISSSAPVHEARPVTGFSHPELAQAVYSS
ncbi:hypothetical protein FRC06_011863 [Ceratobasidium sp. 370]|nr:hypothetical protein FRC06_011863 [Ceratobasidium sp. 370]